METSGVGAVTRIGDLHDTHQDPSAARPTGGHQHPSPATRGEPGHLRGHQGRHATRGHHRSQATRGDLHTYDMQEQFNQSILLLVSQ